MRRAGRDETSGWGRAPRGGSIRGTATATRTPRSRALRRGRIAFGSGRRSRFRFGFRARRDRRHSRSRPRARSSRRRRLRGRSSAPVVRRRGQQSALFPPLVRGSLRLPRGRGRGARDHSASRAPRSRSPPCDLRRSATPMLRARSRAQRSMGFRREPARGWGTRARREGAMRRSRVPLP